MAKKVINVIKCYHIRNYSILSTTLNRNQVVTLIMMSQNVTECHDGCCLMCRSRETELRGERSSRGQRPAGGGAGDMRTRTQLE